jgi:hypothetical protein
MSDALSTYGLIFGGTIAVLSAGATFFNKKTYEGRITLLQAGNDELRSQNKDLRDERTDLKSNVAAITARCEEKERMLQDYKEQNLRLPDFSNLTSIIVSNHKEVMTALSKVIPDGK